MDDVKTEAGCETGRGRMPRRLMEDQEKRLPVLVVGSKEEMAGQKSVGHIAVSGWLQTAGPGRKERWFDFHSVKRVWSWQ